MAKLSPFTARAAVRALVDAGDGRALRAMIREYTELALERFSQLYALGPEISATITVSSVMDALEVAFIARDALRRAENQGIIKRLPDTLTSEEIEGIDA